MASDHDLVLAACRASQDRPYPSASAIAAVHKEECCLCFDTPDSEGGLLVDLVSLLPFCGQCALWNHERCGHAVYLRIQSKEGTVSDEPGQEGSEHPRLESSAAAVAEDGAEGSERPLKKQSMSPAIPSTSSGARTVMSVLAEEHSSLRKDLSYAVVALPSFATAAYPVAGLPPQMDALIVAIIAAEAEDRKQQLQQFEAGSEKKVSAVALSLEQLNNGVRISPSPAQWKCAKCAVTENLWLNLTDGTILCGRANWDGTGGNGHALAHFQETQYPLAVKLGTVTRDLSTADVFSYLEDDAVVDPLLEQHLQHFGIDFREMVKTEKTTAERELEQNLSFEWARVEERGQQLQPVSGPGLTGLRNLGNSYYSSTSLRNAFFHSPPQPTSDFQTQLVKLGHGLLSGKYSKPGSASKEPNAGDAEQRGIPPRMFKSVIGRKHPEFSTSRQQDAFEYFQYLFELLQQQAERGDAAQPGSAAEPGQRPSRQFEFRVEERIRCGASGQVRVTQREDNALSLPIPMEAAVAPPEAPTPSSGGTSPVEEAGENRTGADTASGPVQPLRRSRVPLMACLQAFASADEIPSFFSTAINGVTTAQRTVRFLTFPNYLTLHMRKYVVDTTSWTPRKLDIELDVPRTIDISFLRAPDGGGLQPGEVALPDSEAETSGGSGTPAAAPAAPVPEPGIVSALEAMGFPRELCEKGAVATRNAGVEEAATWILTDGAAGEDVARPSTAPVTGTSPEVADEDVATLMSFGFAEVAARNALAHCGPNVERAADWILNNPEAAERPLAAAPSPGGEAAQKGSMDSAPPPDGHGKYELFAFISHLGANTQCGHYVCHIKKNGRWVLFNDQKVALSEDPPFELGYLYFFERTSA